MLRPKMIRKTRRLNIILVTNSEVFTDKHTSSDTDIQCTDDCTIKANAQFVCCNICMEWYHPNCVGINNIDDVGAWVCARRRLLPKTVNQLKSQMTTVLDSIHKIITCISELTEKMENKFDNFNDRLTVISNQYKQVRDYCQTRYYSSFEQ